MARVLTSLACSGCLRVRAKSKILDDQVVPSLVQATSNVFGRS